MFLPTGVVASLPGSMSFPGVPSGYTQAHHSFADNAQKGKSSARSKRFNMSRVPVNWPAQLPIKPGAGSSQALVGNRRLASTGQTVDVKFALKRLKRNSKGMQRILISVSSPFAVCCCLAHSFFERRVTAVHDMWMSILESEN